MYKIPASYYIAAVAIYLNSGYCSHYQCFEFMVCGDFLPVLRRDYSVKEIGLFGSFSDNSFTDDSDIDLLVEFEKPIGWKYFSLEIYLENIFGRKIDLVTKNALKEQIKDRILKQVNYL